MFYQRKAQSFTSLAEVENIEDLPKKSISYNKRMKSCRTYGGGLDNHRIWYSPKATISKKASRGPLRYSPKATISRKASRGRLSSSLLGKRGSFLERSRLSIVVYKNL